MLKIERNKQMESFWIFLIYTIITGIWISTLFASFSVYFVCVCEKVYLLKDLQQDYVVDATCLF